MWHPTTNLICPLSVLSCHWSVRNEMHFPKLFDTLLNPMASGIPFKCSIHIHWHVQVIAKYIWSSYDHIQLGNYPFSCICCRYKYLICAWINKLSCYLLGSVIWVYFFFLCAHLSRTKLTTDTTSQQIILDVADPVGSFLVSCTLCTWIAFLPICKIGYNAWDVLHWASRVNI